MMKYLLQSISISAVISLGILLPISYADSLPTASPAVAPIVSAAPVTPIAATPVESAATIPTPVPPAVSEPTSATPPVTANAPAPDSATEPPVQKAQKEEPVPAGKTLVARVVWVKGGFGATMPGSTEKRVLQRASNVYMNDTVITEPGGTAQIVFTDNSVMTFRADTKLYINEYNYVPKSKDTEVKKSAGKYVMDLITGGFRTVTGLVAKENPNDYKVNTPVATIGVRGTTYTAAYVAAKDAEKKDELLKDAKKDVMNSTQKKPEVIGTLSVMQEEGAPCVKCLTEGGGEQCLDQHLRFATATDPAIPAIATEKMPAGFESVRVPITKVDFQESANFHADDKSGIGMPTTESGGSGPEGGDGAGPADGAAPTEVSATTTDAPADSAPVDAGAAPTTGADEGFSICK